MPADTMKIVFGVSIALMAHLCMAHEEPQSEQHVYYVWHVADDGSPAYVVAIPGYLVIAAQMAEVYHRYHEEIQAVHTDVIMEQAE